MLQQFQIQSGESFYYKQGYDSTILEVHKQYNLKSEKNYDILDQTKKTVPNQPTKIKEALVSKILQILPRHNQNPSRPTIVDITPNQPSDDHPYTSIPPKKPVDTPQNTGSENLHKEVPNKGKEDHPTQIPSSKSPNSQTEKDPFPFNSGAEVSKLKILVPLTELIKHETYKTQINQTLNLAENGEYVNLFDDQPELIFGPNVNGKPLEGGIPPFYISLGVHEKILHNAMLDFGASYNLISKSIMEKLNLRITRPYKDLISFDSSQVKFLGLIKDLCVTLIQYPTKSILVEIMVADIPPNYDMLLSRPWGAKLQGSLQLDMSATIYVFGQPKKLYQETLMKYMVSS